jgi:hypothetical protein
LKKIIELEPYKEIQNEIFNELFISVQDKYFKNVEYKDGLFIFKFNFCRFKKISIQNDENINFKDITIVFQDCFIQHIEILSLESNNISLIFLNGVAAGNLKSKKLLNVSFNNTIILNNFFLSDIPKIDIRFSENNLHFKRWNSFLINNGLSRQSLLKQEQRFNIYNPKKVNYNTTELQSVNKLYYKDPVQIGGELKTSLSSIEKQMFDVSLNIYFENSDYVDLNIKDSYLKSLMLSKSASGNIIIENTFIDNLYLYTFQIQGKLNFYKLSPKEGSTKNKKIEIHQSNLNFVKFEKTNFLKYDLISFYRTNFDGCQFIACDFPEKPDDYEKFKSLANIHYPNVQSNNFYKDQFEIFIQIKSILEKSGNFQEALKLNAMACESLRKTTDINIWDKAILNINALSNYHNLSLKRAMFGFLVSTISIYLLYLNSLNKIFFDGDIDWTLFGYYFSFIDLTHKSEFLVTNENFTFGSLLFDFIGKIFIGFYLYQFIAVFRKYGKK